MKIFRFIKLTLLLVLVSLYSASCLNPTANTTSIQKNISSFVLEDQENLFVKVGKRFYMSQYSPDAIKNDHILEISADTVQRKGYIFQKIFWYPLEHGKQYKPFIYGIIREESGIVYFGELGLRECGDLPLDGTRVIYDFNLKNGDSLYTYTQYLKAKENIPKQVEFQDLVSTVTKDSTIELWQVNRLGSSYSYKKHIGNTFRPFNVCVHCIDYYATLIMPEPNCNNDNRYRLEKIDFNHKVIYQRE